MAIHSTHRNDIATIQQTGVIGVLNTRIVPYTATFFGYMHGTARGQNKKTAQIGTLAFDGAS